MTTGSHSEPCINWPCAKGAGHAGPCGTSRDDLTSKERADRLDANVSLFALDKYASDTRPADIEFREVHELCKEIERLTRVNASLQSIVTLRERAEAVAWAKVREIVRLRAADEPPAVDVAPIAKLTVRDGLVQRAGLYAPGLPDGDHDVFPVPLSPKGELRPHVLAEPPPVDWFQRTVDAECALVDARRYVEAYEPKSVSEAHDRDLMLGTISAITTVTKSAVQEYQKASLSICEHPHVDFGRCTYCDAVVGAAVETSEGQPWKCTICNNMNPDDATHCRQCEYSRMVMRHGQRVPRDGRL